ncbi:guanylate kinase [Chlamydia pneumoniae]|uniref:Guanylate kinase n=2 Tax=Chlamydia pneumoniae TaxID=83558 RepID=KGUA_CHLPN|nr:guanylate kinase [Chlamydia pneumoniae]Q9Z961.1 RecName: Full=Guanylate kinase; AltName: Full=GMP kinase [Chlamydia pneumoniae]AAD18273.1 GMP Kinase [Chlamydia pneumoniae CWL029]AAF38468.1 guanylate kinase [Chlamydia pneumoniae AR39]CRI32617.1 Guanylate kinase [Chlamydia pneumoniae]CRI35478.1 Guanylate kinase [Chlamydia pneumoniae]CRI36604.1 Guanylate kinase [Chlamydia pneumoniae]
MNKILVDSPFSPDHQKCCPKLFTISAPAGVGKTTLVRMLEQEFSSAFAETISVTTRKPREGEVPGKDYHFVSHEEFQRLLDRQALLEWVFLFGECYGTSMLEIERIWSLGKHAVAVIDIQGALFIRSRMPSVSIFIAPPSQEELERRLASRGSEEGSQRKERLEHSLIELAAANQFDYVIINDDLNQAYRVLKSIFIAEEHRNIL